ncbi:MAG: PTS glucitol/sorbitol transporter subunit IIA [Synergistaceae bacterium]|jgi:PTS system glucitol/sorbitol-specific IIA component|nr:PTS glucitol/sorbitol transporter subunit IIA [Synergistaceae bacterium]
MTLFKKEIQVNYKTTITQLGRMADEIALRDMLIIFNEGAPEELAEFSVLHTQAALTRDVSPGDKVLLGDGEFTVTAVGEKANSTLRKMGHCTFKFGGTSAADLPGQIQLEGRGMPSVNPGDPFEVHFKG